MSFENFVARRKLKKERSYASIQENLSRFRELGIDEYIYLGDGCDICKSLNGKSFLVRDAKVGVNLPPMHPGCRCTIVPNSKIDLFKDRNGANPLKTNPKFEEWKQRQQAKDS